MSSELYLIALGSNQRHKRFGSPRTILTLAIPALEARGLSVVAHSNIVHSRPIGPSSRCYVNSVAIVSSSQNPKDLIRTLKSIEADFGRRWGQKWSRRVLDLDIILWCGGMHVSKHPPLTIPHPMLRERNFVLGPASEIAADWRDPISGLSITQLSSRLNRPKPLDPTPKRH